jgi:hypothetical protein
MTLLYNLFPNNNNFMSLSQRNLTRSRAILNP